MLCSIQASLLTACKPFVILGTARTGLLESQAGADGWQEGSPLTAPALQAWLLVIQLMEDEDDEVHVTCACDC